MKGEWNKAITIYTARDTLFPRIPNPRPSTSESHTQATFPLSGRAPQPTTQTPIQTPTKPTHKNSTHHGIRLDRLRHPPRVLHHNRHHAPHPQAAPNPRHPRRRRSRQEPPPARPVPARWAEQHSCPCACASLLPAGHVSATWCDELYAKPTAAELLCGHAAVCCPCCPCCDNADAGACDAREARHGTAGVCLMAQGCSGRLGFLVMG
ncbi:hypothetical protein M8818_004306 [Zalaria obscura]|uniref:Uncharacterized protein n=1 Tax=Zalaria obscura TaxID=2024903 RepID=A0ACC3SD13_9PEZI